MATEPAIAASAGFAGIPDREALLRRIPTLEWIHTINLGGGVFTPGRWGPPPEFLVRAFDAIDFGGKRVLDIGCWDGLWSFEAERRGAAEVVATDYVRHRQNRDQPTFRLAHQILGSRVRYEPDLSVYDVERLGIRDFDIVIFCGVYYHLKHPLLALGRLRRVLREGGLILVEGETIPSSENTAAFYYHEEYKQDVSNWWIPSIRTLREWVQCSYFRVHSEFAPDVPGPTRHAIVAEAVRAADRNYAFPDEELAEFDLNVY